MIEALKIVDSTISKCEKIQPKFSDGTSQYTLLKNRINALHVSRALIITEHDADQYSKEELLEALKPVTSIINKCESGQKKYVLEAAQYKRFQKIIDAMTTCKILITDEIERRKMKNMESTKQQLLRNSDIEPTEDVISEALGEAYNAYVKFVSELEHHDIRLEWRYYTDGKAWLAKGLHQWIGARGGQNSVTAFWLSIWDGFFKVTIYMPEKALTDALCLPIDDTAKQKITVLKRMGEKLRYFPVVFELHSEEQFETVYTLADFRKSIK